MRGRILVGLVIAGVCMSGHSAADTSAYWRTVLRSPDAPPPPWRPRVRPAPDWPWEGVVPVDAWPAEPPSPTAIDAERLAPALEQLCGKLRAPRSLAGWILESSAEFDVDPFLVAAVIYHQSKCSSRSSEPSSVEVGLARIRVQTHASFVRDGRYRFWTARATRWDPWGLEPEERRWTAWELDVGRFPLSRQALEQPRASVYHTAALLAIYRDQCADLDTAIRSEPHRHFVSHFFWGDRVLGTRFEEGTLLDRRRLIASYIGSVPEPRARFEELRLHRGAPEGREQAQLPLSCPLDGAPRVVSSRYNERRDGRRRHRGIDFSSAHGEAVRAVADGTVVFAGVQPRGRRARSLGPSARPSRMGRGGLFVLVDHGHDLVSGYFHLARHAVRKGVAVKAGQVIGAVGRTGMIDSRSHLHLELRVHGRNIDPTPHLRPYLMLPATKSRRPPPARPES